MSQEQAQQLMYQLQILEAYLADLIQRENSLVTLLRDLASSIESLKGISEKTESETLAPLGVGVYVKTKILSNDKVVLNIGAGVAIEKDRDSATNFLESRIKEIEIALQDTESRKQDIAIKLEQGKAELRKLLEAPSKES
jgi:prefoldin alpha subunit